MITEMEARQEDFETKHYTSECHKCHKHEGQTELVFCSNGSCPKEICCDCADETHWELKVCSDRCALAKVTAMQHDLNTLRAQSSTAAAIVRRGAASYIVDERKVA